MNAKTVLITGATSGIGEALFHQYLSQGHQVIACGRNQEKLAELSLLASIKGINTENNYSTSDATHVTNVSNATDTANMHSLTFDITNEEAVAGASKNAPLLDVLILNAGNCKYLDDVMQFNSASFAEVVSTNLLSMASLLKHFLPKMRKGGQVVFISSSATIMPFPRAEAYGASKAGVDYLAKSLRLDLVRHDIGVTLVHPGFIKTPLTDQNDFSMPFMISAEDAALRIFNGVEKRKQYLHFPKRLTLLLKTFSFLPNCLWHSLILKDTKS